MLYALAIGGAFMVGGCGQDFTDVSALRLLLTTECEGQDVASTRAVDWVLLDWDGGTSPLYPSISLDPLDLAVFETPDGGTLADRADEFKERVRGQITRIFCDFPEAAIRVDHAGQERNPNATVVHLAQLVSPHGGAQIGEGEYDPCNQYHDDAAVIFGEQIRRLGGPRPLDDWVLMFANVTAHEIGHMVGFGHILRDQQPETSRSLYVELMLDGHTIDELKREQRFVVPQTNCPKTDTTASRCIHKPVADWAGGE